MTRDLPFVSVILPTFNRPVYLITALECLLNQDYPSVYYEVIIVDNGSLDETIEAVRSFCEINPLPVNLKYVREQRPGLVYARHTGAFHAQGSVLIFGDDDARYENNWISAVVDVYQMYPEVGAVGTQILIEWDSTPPPWVLPYERVLGRLAYDEKIVVKVGLQIYGGSFSIKKELLLLLGGFNPGQVGEYILGDSETGLCRKLQDENVQVAWTPHTTMWHRQIVSRHATLKDIKRRFWNNGICSAYNHSFCLDDSFLIKYKNIIVFLFNQFGNLVCRDLIMMKSVDKYLFVMDMELIKSYIIYLIRFKFDNKLINKLQYAKWTFSSGYSAPAIEFIVAPSSKKSPCYR